MWIRPPMRNPLKRAFQKAALALLCVAASGALFLGGCDWMASPGAGWEATGIQSGKSVIPPPDGRAVLVLNSFHLYPESREGRLHSCFLRGTVMDGEFYPDTPLKIRGPRPEVPNPRPANWAPGWVEFAPLRRHLDVESVSRRPPYLHGVFDPEGAFYPDSTKPHR